MINANELRIGNYISSGYYVTKDQLIIISDGEDIDFYCEKITIMPIELTEEWLVRLGFKRVNKGVFDEVAHTYELSFKLNAGSNQNVLIYTIVHRDELEDYGSYTVNDFWASSYFKYVHQLQNLYFALTGKELEIK